MFPVQRNTWTGEWTVPPDVFRVSDVFRAHSTDCRVPGSLWEPWLTSSGVMVESMACLAVKNKLHPRPPFFGVAGQCLRFSPALGALRLTPKKVTLYLINSNAQVSTSGRN